MKCFSNHIINISHKNEHDMCYICYKNDHLVYSQCECNLLVHPQCLITWIQNKPSHNKVFSCEICKYRYNKLNIYIPALYFVIKIIYMLVYTTAAFYFIYIINSLYYHHNKDNYDGNLATIATLILLITLYFSGVLLWYRIEDIRCMKIKKRKKININSEIFDYDITCQHHTEYWNNIYYQNL